MCIRLIVLKLLILINYNCLLNDKTTFKIFASRTWYTKNLSVIKSRTTLTPLTSCPVQTLD